MVAITVAIAAPVYVYISGMMGDSGFETTPYATLSKDTTSTSATFTIMSLSANDVYWSDVEVNLYNLSDDGELMNASYIDKPDGDTTVTGGDIIIITGLDKKDTYRIILIYVHTSNVITSTTWTQ